MPHGHEPLYYRFGMCDAANAMLSVVGVLAALYHQRTTGEGQELWTSLMDGGAVFSSDTLLRADGTPEYRPKLDAGQHGFAPGYRLYETQDGWIQIAAIRDEHWDAFCRATGVSRGARPRARPRRRRGAARSGVRARSRRCRGRTCSTTRASPTRFRSTCRAASSRCTTRTSSGSGMVVDYEHPIMGAMRQFGHLINFSDTPGRIYGPAPRVGEHSLRDPRRARVLAAARWTTSRRPASSTGPTPTTAGPGSAAARLFLARSARNSRAERAENGGGQWFAPGLGVRSKLAWMGSAPNWRQARSLATKSA